jgi:DNA-binding NtrC family response regulator
MTSPRVCIIDDEPPFIRLCEHILASEGYGFESLEDLARAAEAVATSRPDVVVLDIRLGSEADGLQILAQLASNASTRDIPILICTASRDLLTTHQDLIEELGCEVVEKPFDVETFVSAIERCLESSRPADSSAAARR